MSNYLGFNPNGEIAANVLITAMHDHYKAELVGYGWRVAGEDKANDQHHRRNGPL